LSGNVGLFCTDSKPAAVKKCAPSGPGPVAPPWRSHRRWARAHRWFDAYRRADYARAGAVVTETVVLPEGERAWDGIRLLVGGRLSGAGIEQGRSCTMGRRWHTRWSRSCASWACRPCSRTVRRASHDRPDLPPSLTPAGRGVCPGVVSLTGAYTVCTAGTPLSAEGAHALVRPRVWARARRPLRCRLTLVDGWQKLLGQQLAEFHVTLLASWHKGKFVDLAV
jgi:hypothetical protein